MPLCLLVRHGLTTSNAAGTLAGWTPGVELDQTGRRQVEALAERVRVLPVRRVVSSPLTRCLQTMDLLRTAWPEAVVGEHEGLGECRYGAWTGGKLAELVKEPLWRVVQEHPSAARFPDGPQHPGESIADMSSRAVAAVRSIDAEVAREFGATSIWVAVSHGDIIKAILADAAGSHLDHFQRIVVDPASLSAVCYTPRRPFVLRVNDSGGDMSALSPVTGHDGDAQIGGGAGADT
ncbi:MAG TPA: MSMEG_4193 family putative phosphomutase [Dermatophilaceae bacterium]|nr:MSMEG_4193 family putative phosphomutase [Dermatophilaceae bacterium]